MASTSSANNRITLSPSALNLFLECPKCFWLERVRKIHRPKGPFPSLPGGMDMVIKKYFDQFRRKGVLPPELEGKVSGTLVNDQLLLTQWRDWRRGIRWYDEALAAEFMGALDDCLVDESSGTPLFAPIDYKTRGWAVKEDSHTYYQNQLDCYTLLLEKNGYAPAGLAYLVFYSPDKVAGKGVVHFNTEIVKVATNPEDAYQTFARAVQLLSGPMPKQHSGCTFCSWGNDFVNFE